VIGRGASAQKRSKAKFENSRPLSSLIFSGRPKLDDHPADERHCDQRARLIGNDNQGAPRHDVDAARPLGAQERSVRHPAHQVSRRRVDLPELN